MSSANKNKGKRGEREVADHLCQVFGLNFERVPNSGAFTGGKNFFRKQQLTETQNLLAEGDIIVPDELKHLCFEVKTYKDFSFAGVYSKNKQLDDWIAQASATKKIWFLIFKINHAGAFVVYDRKYENIFKNSGCFSVYQGVYILSGMAGFFEQNKELLLNPLRISDLINNNSPVSSSNVESPQA
jgi:Holliday junction resolvase